MEAFKAARFEWVFIGLESPSEESLVETKKNQNLRGDMLSNLRTIYSYGIDILAGFIIGFDHDDETIFERQYKFIMESGIAVSMVGLLVALPKTPLYQRLEKAGRLIANKTPDGTRPYTNIIPEKMTQEQLVEGYQKLMFRLRSDRAIHERLINKVKYLQDPPTTPYLTLGQKLSYFFRLIFLGVIPGGPRRIYYFTKSFFWGLLHPRSLPVILTDWIASIALKNFGDRYRRVAPSQAETTLALLKQKLIGGIAAPFGRGLMDLRLSILQNRPHIWIDLKQELNPKAVKVLYRTLSKTLKESREAIVLDLHQLKESQLQNLELLLKKLRRYHEQIQIQISEALYSKLKDQLVFFQYSLVTT
jgi:hypothetical protein